MCCCKQIKMNIKSCTHPYSPTYPWLGCRGSSSSRDTQTSPSPQAVGNWSLGPLPMTATLITQPHPFLNPPTGGEPTGRWAYVVSSGCAQLGPVGTDLATDLTSLVCEPQPQAWLKGGGPVTPVRMM